MNDVRAKTIEAMAIRREPDIFSDDHETAHRAASPMRVGVSRERLLSEAAKDLDAALGVIMQPDEAMITHEQAQEALTCYINAQFNRSGPLPVAQIPARPGKDTDLVLSSYIKQQSAMLNEMKGVQS